MESQTLTITDGQQPPYHDKWADSSHGVHDTGASLHLGGTGTDIRARTG